MFRMVIYTGTEAYEFPVNPSSCEYIPVQYKVEPFESATGDLTPAVSFSKTAGSLNLEGGWVREEDYSFFKNLFQSITGVTVLIITPRREAFKGILAESRLSMPDRRYSASFHILEEDVPPVFEITGGATHNKPFKYWVSGGTLLNNNTILVPAGTTLVFRLGNIEATHCVLTFANQGEVVINLLDEYGQARQTITFTSEINDILLGVSFRVMPTEVVEFPPPVGIIADSIVPNPYFVNIQRVTDLPGVSWRPTFWRVAFSGVTSLYEAYNGFGYLMTSSVGSPTIELHCEEAQTTTPKGITLRTGGIYNVYTDIITEQGSLVTLNVRWYSPDGSENNRTINLSQGITSTTLVLPPITMIRDKKIHLWLRTTLRMYESVYFKECSVYKSLKTPMKGFSFFVLESSKSSDNDTFYLEYSGTNPKNVSGWVYFGNIKPVYYIGDMGGLRSTQTFYPYTAMYPDPTHRLARISKTVPIDSRYPFYLPEGNYLFIIQYKTGSYIQNIRYRFREGTIDRIIVDKTYPKNKFEIIHTHTFNLTDFNELDFSVINLSTNKAFHLLNFWLLPPQGTIFGTFAFPLRIHKGIVYDDSDKQFPLPANPANGRVFACFIPNAPIAEVNDTLSLIKETNV